jgi:flavin reductase (DIM6/NTAB) family NADH-FMN oxidoreductase RutF
MRGVGASVTVVATNGKAGRRGAPVLALCSVSADPPTILVCLNGSSGIADEVAENRLFNVNILRVDQEVIAQRFAGHDDDHLTDRFHIIVIALVYAVKHPHLAPLGFLNGDFYQLVRTKHNS